MEQDLSLLLYTYFHLVIHFPNTHWHLLCIQLVLGDVDRERQWARPDLVLQLTSRMSTEVREGPHSQSPNGWERPDLRTQRQA